MVEEEEPGRRPARLIADAGVDHDVEIRDA
jgi:hypothetical protein